MPSLQSHVFKLMTKAISRRMNAIASIPELRAYTDTISRPLPLPRGTRSRAVSTDGIALEWIMPPKASPDTVILYLHGGGWVLGWYNTHRVLAAHIGRASLSRVLAVDYRLAPEHPFPAALEDVTTVYRRLLEEGIGPDRIVLAGDSAGANLVLASLMTIRDGGDPLPAAGVCISPMVDLTGEGETFRGGGDALLTPEFALSMARSYLGDAEDPRAPLLSPLFANLTGLPPLLIQAGGDEILLSDATRLAARARAAGVDVTLTVWPGMWHVWHTCAPWLPEARRAVGAIGYFIHTHLYPDPFPHGGSEPYR
ncbi:alpha/beta hydrolase [bacterium]|nr:alpha/beta hydrolase [bacterium]